MYYHGDIYIVLISILGRTHECSMALCGCEPEAVTMLRHGFWPLSPKQPQVGIDVELLKTLQCLTLEGQVSLKIFSNAMALRNQGSLRYWLNYIGNVIKDFQPIK